MKRPEIDFDRATALVVVDVQNDFASPRGSLHIEGGEETVPVINELIEGARRGDAFVVYSQDWHPESTPHFEKDGGEWPVHCVRETWGAELHPDLLTAGPRVRKGTGGEDGYSAFNVRDPETGRASPTPLEGLLEERGVRRVVIAGLAQDVCVLETALDARKLGFQTILAADATRPVNRRPGDGARAIARMVEAGVDVR